MAEYAQSDERGTDEASGWNDMQSSSDKWSPTSVGDYVIGFRNLRPFCVPMCICSINNCEYIWYFVICMYLIVNGGCFGDGYLRFYYFCMWCTFLYI